MKDFYGTEVKIGNTVVCMVKNYRSLVEAIVVKITDKTVVVEYRKHWASDFYKEEYRLMSDQFIIVGGY